nr:uncharacterized protein LOC111770654 [Equus caballus]
MNRRVPRRPPRLLVRRDAPSRQDEALRCRRDSLSPDRRRPPLPWRLPGAHVLRPESACRRPRAALPSVLAAFPPSVCSSSRARRGPPTCPRPPESQAPSRARGEELPSTEGSRCLPSGASSPRCPTPRAPLVTDASRPSPQLRPDPRGSGFPVAAVSPLSPPPALPSSRTPLPLPAPWPAALRRVLSGRRCVPSPRARVRGARSIGEAPGPADGAALAGARARPWRPSPRSACAPGERPLRVLRRCSTAASLRAAPRLLAGLPQAPVAVGAAPGASSAGRGEARSARTARGRRAGAGLPARCSAGPGDPTRLGPEGGFPGAAPLLARVPRVTLCELEGPSRRLGSCWAAAFCEMPGGLH